MRKTAAHYAMVLRSPGYRLARETAPGMMKRTKTPLQQKRITSDESPLYIRLVKLLAESRNPKRPVVAVHTFLKNTFDESKRVNHETLSKQPRGVSQALRKEF